MPFKYIDLSFWKNISQRLSVFFTVILVISPLLIAALYTCLQTFRELHDFTLSRREAIAFLAGTTLKEKLDRVVDVGVSFSTRVQFQKLIEGGKWDEAIKIFESAPEDFPYIDRVNLFDTNGILTASHPTTPELIALIEAKTSFAYRDYYKGVSKNWEPYIAEVIKPAVPLGYNLVPVAIPIKSSPDKKIMGILLLTIKLDTVLQWSKSIDAGAGGFMYIVDQKGHLVAHPTLLEEKDIVDFSSVPAVQKILKGERGVEILFNPVENEERITAYEPVSRYGWGVFVAQPTRTAFSERNMAVARMAGLWILVIFAVGFFTYRLLRDKSIIRAQRDKERILLESIGDGVVAIDRSWNITLFNKSAGVISGWSHEEALGKPFRSIIKFVKESDRKENIEFIERAMIFGKVNFMENHTVLMAKDGREIPIGDSAAPIIDENGGITGAIIIFRDIAKEQEAIRIKSDFAYASHQFRTPVTKALWSIETALGEEDANKGRRENLLEAYLAIRSINELSSRLLEISDIDQQRVVKKLESIQLADLFSDVLKSMEEKIKQKNIILTIMPASMASPVKTDPVLLKKSLSEILRNAIEYSNYGGEIKVNVILQEDGILIKIQDFGIGISHDQKQLIFTKFFRGKNIPKDSVGAGLGAYIAREYIRILNGRIWFESEEGSGTTFSIFLSKVG